MADGEVRDCGWRPTLNTLARVPPGRKRPLDVRKQRVLAVTLALAALAALLALRIATGAEYAFASLALLPVIAAAWYSGVICGQVMAVIGAGIWIVGDVQSGQYDWQSSALWANCLPRLVTYAIAAALTCSVARQLRRERELARSDALTGLANRRLFVQRCDIELERSRRYGHSLGMLYLDLDNFKQLNDRLGHAAGDQALIAVAEALRDVTRSADLVARLGGDEFAVLLVEVDIQSASHTTSRISEEVNGALAQFPELSSSTGLAWFEGAGQSVAEMMAIADAVMYGVKRNSPGSYGVKNSSGRNEAGDRHRDRP